ncbi:MAG: hypothetical protein GY847_15220 [Proteobacteria bacterium]|nr:hypothetical protein [Pseudomonadota bacterium]
MKLITLITTTVTLATFVVGCGEPTTKFEIDTSNTDSESTDGDSDVDSDTDIDTDTDSDIDGGRDTDTDKDSDTGTDTDSDTETNTDTGTNTDTDADSDTNTDADSDTNTDIDTDVDTDTGTDADTDIDTDTSESTCSVVEFTSLGLRAFTGTCQPPLYPCEGGKVSGKEKANCNNGLHCCIRTNQCNKVMSNTCKKQCINIVGRFHYGCPNNEWCCVGN